MMNEKNNAIKLIRLSSYWNVLYDKKWNILYNVKYEIVILFSGLHFPHGFDVYLQKLDGLIIRGKYTQKCCFVCGFYIRSDFYF